MKVLRDRRAERIWMAAAIRCGGLPAASQPHASSRIEMEHLRLRVHAGVGGLAAWIRTSRLKIELSWRSITSCTARPSGWLCQPLKLAAVIGAVCTSSVGGRTGIGRAHSCRAGVCAPATVLQVVSFLPRGNPAPRSRSRGHTRRRGLQAIPRRRSPAPRQARGPEPVERASRLLHLSPDRNVFSE